MPTTNRHPAATAPSSAVASPHLLDALSEGMHTLAQPLTVLRATLEIAWGNASTISQYQHAIDTSLAEVTRVADAMGFVQELLRIARDIPQPEEVAIVSLIALVHEDMQCLLESTRVSLALEIPRDLPLVIGSAWRLRQCLFHLMQHAIGLCHSGGTIEFGANAVDGQVLLLLRKWSSDPALHDDFRHVLWGNFIPCLTLAEALAEGYGGRLEWQSEPFAACLSLPTGQPSGSTQRLADVGS